MAPWSRAWSSESPARVVSTSFWRTSSSRCDPAPSLTRFFERLTSVWARVISLLRLLMVAFATATCSFTAATFAIASASSAFRVAVSIRTSTWPGFTRSPSLTSTCWTFSGSLEATSTSLASIRPFPETIPSGSAFFRALQIRKTRNPADQRHDSDDDPSCVGFLKSFCSWSITCLSAWMRRWAPSPPAP